MISPVDIQALSQLSTSAGASGVAADPAFSLSGLADPDPKAVTAFNQAMGVTGDTQSLVPVDAGEVVNKSSLGRRRVDEDGPLLGLLSTEEVFRTLSASDALRLKETVLSWEYQEVRTGKITEQTSQALESVTQGE